MEITGSQTRCLFGRNKLENLIGIDIKEILAFERWLERNYLPGHSQLLWYKLVLIHGNGAGRDEWIQVDHQRLMSMIDVNSKKTFISARDKLVECGLIEYRKGCRGSPGKYRIRCKFYTQSEIGSNFTPNSEPNRELIGNSNGTQTEPIAENRGLLACARSFPENINIKAGGGLNQYPAREKNQNQPPPPPRFDDVTISKSEIRRTAELVSRRDELIEFWNSMVGTEKEPGHVVACPISMRGDKEQAIYDFLNSYDETHVIAFLNAVYDSHYFHDRAEKGWKPTLFYAINIADEIIAGNRSKIFESKGNKR